MAPMISRSLGILVVLAGTAVADPPAPPSNAPGNVTPIRYDSPAAGSRTPAIATTIATGIVLVGGIVSYEMMSSKVHEAGTAHDGVGYADSISSANHWQTATVAFTGLSVLGAITSGFLWSRSERQSHFGVSATENSATFSLGGKF